MPGGTQWCKLFTERTKYAWRHDWQHAAMPATDTKDAQTTPSKPSSSACPSDRKVVGV